MDYRLRDLTAEQLAAALVDGHREAGVGDGRARRPSSTSLPPIPNYFFQRDPLVVVGERAIRASMATPARQREPLLSGYVLSAPPAVRDPGGREVLVPEFSCRLRARRTPSRACPDPTLEGGDVLVLREDLLAIGYSERTEKTTIERLAEDLRGASRRRNRILVVAVPPARSYMHLDTVFTMTAGRVPRVPADDPAGRRRRGRRLRVDLTKRELTWTTEKTCCRR